MKKSIMKNYLYNLAYQILIIIMPIITTPYLSRTLGASGIGTYSYTISIVTYFILFGSFGTAIYGQREVAYVQDDTKKRSIVFYEILILRCITMPIAMIVFYLLYCRTGLYYIYFRILLLEMLSTCFDISWFFQGIENFKKTAVRNIVIKIISVISIFLFIKNENDTSKYLIIYTLTNLLGNVSLWIGLKKYITKVELKEIRFLRQLKPAITFFIPQIAIQIYTVLDKTMIGAITNNMSEVGYYEQTQKIVKMLLTIITSLGTVMVPRISKCYIDGDTLQIKKYMNKTFRFVYMLAFPLIFGIIATADNFVPLFLGEGYETVKLLMKIMSWIILFIGLGNILGSQYLLSTKQQGKFTICVVCGAIVNVILNSLMIPKLQSLGAVIATVVAEFSVTAMEFYFVRKEFEIKEILILSRNYIVSALIMFIIVQIPKVLIHSGIITILVQVIFGVIVYFVALLTIKDEMIIELKNKFLKKRIKE